LIKQTVSDSFIRLGHSSSLKNTFKILDFGFSTLVRKGPVAKGLMKGQYNGMELDTAILHLLMKGQYNGMESYMYKPWEIKLHDLVICGHPSRMGWLTGLNNAVSQGWLTGLNNALSMVYVCLRKVF
jgi:hypothetical protein